ncbi:hypothetical protein IG631_24326 [Alternaria alternata]|nr:hypothetical protein IG631_24326 [Alternaria alternata]
MSVSVSKPVDDVRRQSARKMYSLSHSLQDCSFSCWRLGHGFQVCCHIVPALLRYVCVILSFNLHDRMRGPPASRRAYAEIPP